MMLFIMMMVTVISVAGRYFLQMDLIPGAYNIVERIIFPLLVFWALPIAHRDGMFPRLESFADALRRDLKAAVRQKFRPAPPEGETPAVRPAARPVEEMELATLLGAGDPELAGLVRRWVPYALIADRVAPVVDALYTAPTP